MSNHEDRAFRVVDPYYGELTPDTDDVMFRHGEDKYDHLRYHCIDDEEIGSMAIRLVFFSQNALDILAEGGIPEAYLDKPTSITEQAYINDQISRMEQEVENE